LSQSHGLDPARHVDRLAFSQSNDRFLHIRALVGLALPPLGLALRRDRIHANHGDTEERFDGRLDLGLRRLLILALIFVAFGATLNTTELVSDSIVDFSVMWGASTTS
jgi:hypothetical protein